MKGRNLIWILILILSLSSVSADLTPNLQFHYSFDDADTNATHITDSTGQHDGTITGATTGVAGLLGEAYDFDGTNDIVNSNFDTNSTLEDFTISIWVKSADTTQTAKVFGNYDTGTEYLYLGHHASLGWISESRDSNSASVGATTSNTRDTNWHHLVLRRDSSNNNYTVHKDNALLHEKSDTRTGHFDGGNAIIGAFSTSADYFDGLIDEVSMWNRVLSDDEITALYNAGAGCAYSNYATSTSSCAAGSSASNFTVTAINRWDGSTIYDFNATVNGTLYNSNTTTGQVVTPILDNQTALVTVLVESENYFDNTTLNVNVSSNHQSKNYKYAEIYANDLINGSSINNFQIDYVNEANSSETGTVSTTNGIAYIPSYSATYTLNISNAYEGSQYYSNSNTSLTASDYLQNYTFSLFRSNTVNITFYHERDLLLADDINITTELIVEGVWAQNYSISTGVLFLEDLTVGDFEVRYSATGFPERSYFFNLQNNTYVAINLYVANGTNTDPVTNTLYDDLGNKLSNYYIKLLRYYASSNSYLLVEECKTNFAGECVLNAELSSETQSIYYKFRIVGSDGTIHKTTQSTRIYDTSLTHFVILTNSITEELQQLNTISYDTTFLTSSDQFKFTWDDSSGTASGATLELYTLTSNLTETLVSTTTVASASGTIYVPVTDDNLTYYRTKSYVGGTYVQTVDKDFLSSVDIFGVFGIFLTILITIAVAAIGWWNPIAAIILVPVSLFVTKIATLNPMPYSILSAIGGVALILIFAISAKE